MLAAQNEPWVVIMDFQLVLGIDSSAAQAIAKLRGNLLKTFNVETLCYATGSDDGFPCEFGLSAELTDASTKFSGSYVFESLNDALIFAEDAILNRQDPLLICDDLDYYPSDDACERDRAIHFLTNLCPGNSSKEDIEALLACYIREEYTENDTLWMQGSRSDCSKIVVRGTLISLLENEAGTVEHIGTGNTIGELGLVHGVARFSSVRCFSSTAVLYSLSRESYEKLVEENPRLARLIDLICVRYLTSRVQHVSNRIFETRCLPI
jgi:SulP family sulfate permease